jgi:hypothetical protein
MKLVKYFSAAIMSLCLVNSALAAGSSYLAPLDSTVVKAGSDIYIYYGLGVNDLICKSSSKGHQFFGTAGGTAPIWTNTSNEVTLDNSIGAPTSVSTSGVLVFRAGKNADAIVSCEYRSKIDNAV